MVTKTFLPSKLCDSSDSSDSCDSSDSSDSSNSSDSSDQKKLFHKQISANNSTTDNMMKLKNSNCDENQ